MAQWCLTRQAEEKLLEELKKEGDPRKMVARGTEGRLKWFTERVGEENAHKLNALFEQKMLLKNQMNGFKSFAKSLGGEKPVQKNMFDKINNLNKALDEKGVEQFLNDLVNTRLGLSVSQTEFDTMTKLSNKVNELATYDKKTFKFPTEADRFKYGFAKVQFENYVNDLKLKAKGIKFKEEPVRYSLETIGKIPGVMKSTMASLDNSLWGRQGFLTLADPRTSDIWFKDFVKSWKDFGKELKGVSAMDLVKADIYSRPNALNGKYTAGRYGLDVLTEEAFPSSVPEKIPAFRRLFKASESAYNGGALRLRADLADRYIKKAEEFGVNTLNRDEAKPLGEMISSFTGRGKLGSFETSAKVLNDVFFSVRWLKSTIDTVLAPANYYGRKVGLGTFKSKGDEFAKKTASRRTLNAIMTLGSLLLVAKALDPEGTELDPRSSKFGKVRVFGNYVDVTAGHAGLLTLISRIMPTLNNGKLGFWYKNNKGETVNLTEDVKFGGMTAWDVLNSFFEGKLSPVARIFKDTWTGQNFDGEPVVLEPLSLGKEILSSVTPLAPASAMQLLKNPNTPAWAIPVSLMLEFLGVSANGSVVPNTVSKTFQENKKVDNKTLIDYISTYAEAIGTDPETAFNRIFTGQEIVKVSNDAIIVKRMPLEASQEVKKKANANNPTMKLDHTIPLELGGDNSSNNLKLVPTSVWNSYTSVENALGKALKEKKISKQKAQDLIVKFKNKELTKNQVLQEIK